MGYPSSSMEKSRRERKSRLELTVASALGLNQGDDGVELGYEDGDWEGAVASDRLVDALVAWADEKAGAVLSALAQRSMFR